MENRLEENEKPQLPNEGRPWLMITVNADSSVKVSGVVHDKILSYGLLKVAQDSIKDFHDKQEKIGRVNSSGGLIETIRGRLWK